MSTDTSFIVCHLRATNEETDRRRAMRTLPDHLLVMPAEQVDLAMHHLHDIFEEDVPLPTRLLGFQILVKVIPHPLISEKSRLLYLRLATKPVELEGLRDQLQMLEELAQHDSLTQGETAIILNYLARCMTKPTGAKRPSKERPKGNARGDAKSIAREFSSDEYVLNKFLTILSGLVKSPASRVLENEMNEALNAALYVVEEASDVGTLESFCHLARTLSDVAHVPEDVLRRFIEDLCAIYGTSLQLQDLTDQSLQALIQSTLCSSAHIGKIILNAIWSPPPERASNTSCGAIKVTKSMFISDRHRQLLEFRVKDILVSLSKADFTSRSVCKESLRLLITLLNAESLALNAINETDWGLMFQVVYAASGLTSVVHQSTKYVGGELSSRQQPGAGEQIAELMHQMAISLTSIWPSASHSQNLQSVQFLYRAEGLLPQGFVTQFLNQLFTDLKLRRQSVIGRKSSAERLMDYFYLHQEAVQNIRADAVDLLCRYTTKVASDEDTFWLLPLVIKLLSIDGDNRSLVVINALAELAMTVGRFPSCTVEQTQELIDLLWPMLNIFDSPEKKDTSEWVRTSRPATNVVVRSISRAFALCLSHNQLKSVRLFECLVKVPQSSEFPSSPRLQALELLCRIRCDQSRRILLAATTDMQDLPLQLFSDFSDQDTHQIRNTMVSRSEKSESQSDRTSSGSGKTSSSFSRGHLRPLARSNRSIRTKPPAWVEAEELAPPTAIPTGSTEHLRVSSQGSDKSRTIHIGDWLVAVISIFQQPTIRWDIYSYIIVHLPAQLRNCGLFVGSMPHITMLRRIIVDQILEGTVYEPPISTGVRKGDVALCLYHSLTILIGYSSSIERKEQERIVHAFFHGIGQWEKTAKFCIQTLAICCHVLPNAVIPRLSAILQKMSQVVTQSSLTIDILEFLAGLARLPSLYRNFREEEFRTVFAICVKYLEHSREQRTRLLTDGDIAGTRPLSGTDPASSTDFLEKPDVYNDTPQYVFALAYQVITAWFLSVKISNRNDYVGWITRNLSWTDEAGNEIMEEQSQVTLDMMMRTSYLDLGETEPGAPFREADGSVLSKTWLLGLSIVTIETATSTGISRLTKRQASGTTYAIYQPQTRELPPHHERIFEDGQGADPGIHIFPNHVLLQLTSSIAPIPVPMEAICLPEDDFVKRAISVFDRNDTVDGYKVGIVFVANGQTDEASILANESGSPAFHEFLEGLGSKVILRGAKFNTQGLDKNDDIDGTHTYAWRDRITEVVFHVSTMMPTDLENDPQLVNKKRHIGNCYVTIVWNESGHPFRFDTLPSQFNCITITIVPDSLYVPRPAIELHSVCHSDTAHDHAFFNVQMLSASSFPDTSPVATSKLLPFKALPLFIRQLALQASVFSNVWVNRETGEHASSWRNRLREIKRLRERFANTGTSTSSKFPGAKSSKTYRHGDSFHGRVSMGGLTEQGENLAASLDFSRWAGPNTSLSNP